MCFTVNVNLVKEELEARYGTGLTDPDSYRPSYYFHAHTLPEMPVVFRNQAGDLSMELFNWGLIPSWVKTSGEAEKIRFMTFNAKAETIGVKPSFSVPFRSRRCLVPVAGFFEWQHTDSRKRPWYIYDPANKIISLAGLFDRWKLPGMDTDLCTFTIITTPANILLSEIHNSKKRMPLVMPQEKEKDWLDHEISVSDLQELMRPLPDGILEAHTVSPLISNQRAEKNVPEIIAPYNYPIENKLF